MIYGKGTKRYYLLAPPELPPMAGKAIDDPTSLGLDLSEPLQIHVVAIEEKDVFTLLWNGRKIIRPGKIYQYG